MSDFFELIYDAALNNINGILADNEEYQAAMKKMAELSEEYQKLDLSEEQRWVIDEFIEISDVVDAKEMRAIYIKGILNCADILKDFKLLA